MFRAERMVGALCRIDARSVDLCYRAAAINSLAVRAPGVRSAAKKGMMSPHMDRPADAALRCIETSDPAKPFVVAQLGQTLDGRIATQNGASRYINGHAALDHLHRLRAAVDAVVVGVGTVIADNPSLTVRRVPGNSPCRIIIDPNGRIPPASKCLSDGGPPVFVVARENTTNDHGLDPIFVRAEADAAQPGSGLCPHAIVAALHERGMKRLLIEGGAFTVSRFIMAGAVDRLHLLMAPMILGSGYCGLNLPPIHSLDQAMRPLTQIHPLDGGEVVFDCDLRHENKRSCTNDRRHGAK
jgi:diaminohydroxyphosphoribosylaminopyrimidine deaminase/5-amino-6-(5-phosphoribosylamino)uracil reductase